MKNIIILIIVMLGISLYAGNLDNYLYEFDYLNYNQYFNDEINSINTLLYHLHFHDRHWRNMVIYRRLDLNEAEKKAIDVLFNTKTFEIIKPYNEFKKLKEEFPNSIILKALFIEYAYNNFTNTLNKSFADEIYSTIEELENIVGKTPFTKYYKALLFSNRYYNKNVEKAKRYYTELIDKYSPNQRIYNSYIIFMNSINEHKKVAETYEQYNNFRQVYLTQLFLILDSFHKLEKEEEAISLAKRLKEASQANYVLAKVYEVLGDFEKNLEKKAEYYKKAFNLIPTSQSAHQLNNVYPIQNFASIYLKLAKASYELDPEENEDYARVLLNQGNALDPEDKEMESLLKEFRARVRNRVLLKYFLPIGIFVFIGIILILRWEKNIRKNNRGKRKVKS